MKRYAILITLLLQMVFAIAQSIAVSFTAQDQNGNYCQLSEVNVTDVTQNWSQTLTYPDTTLVLNYIDGIVEIPVKEGFIYNRPNPFHGTTEALLNLASGSQTHIQLVNIRGMVLAECDANLAQGESMIKVSLAEPQLALLCASNETGSYVLKMLNIGNGGRNSVEVVSNLKGTKSGTTRADGGQFSLGDEMRYEGVIVQDDGTTVMSNTITQAQYNDEVITFEFEINHGPEGAVDGAFTINNDGLKVYFSQGNLQYQASTHTWRFAENQWDYVGTQTPDISGNAGGTVSGSDNANISFTYDGWIDLFCWGTGLNPTLSSSAYGFNYFHEWGNNAISNGGDQENQWKTLSKDEWIYVLNERNTVSGMRYVRARVNDIHGIILLPDDWQTSFYSFDENAINEVSLSDWTAELKSHGVVFLPMAGSRSVLSVNNVGVLGDYWSSTKKGDSGIDQYFANALFFGLNSYYTPAIADCSRETGCSVRLVKEILQLPTVTTSLDTEATCTTITCGGNVVNDGGLPVTARGICYSTSSSSPTISTTHTLEGSGLGSFVSTLTMPIQYLGQNYYVRAYATNASGTAYGETIQVSTQGPCLPALTTVSVTNVTETSALCRGNVLDDYGSPVTERGVCYSKTNAQPTIEDSHNPANYGGIGEFSCSISSLEPNTAYHCRAYATNSAGTAYGEVIVFTTLPEYGVPIVITDVAIGVTANSANCGGNVTNDGGAIVTERGVCYSKTNTQPTYFSGNHIASGSGTGVFSTTLSSLDANTTYYYCAYAMNSYGTGYGQVRSFTTTGGTTPPDPGDSDLLSGQFSVSATRKVSFSKGNLQYQASSGTWRFATNQYDVIGTSNDNISSTYSGYIDLFGWGTSGYNGCMPYQTIISTTYGGNLSSIANTNYDWGVQNMSGYRTLTADEWNYVLSERTNALARKAPATVNDVHGWVLLPDNWSNTSYSFVSYEDGARSYSSNVYTSTQWSGMQTAGAVFLPAAGWRYSSGSVSMTSYVGYMGYYWSANSQNAVNFAASYCYSGEEAANYSGCAVRLVRTVQ